MENSTDGVGIRLVVSTLSASIFNIFHIIQSLKFNLYLSSCYLDKHETKMLWDMKLMLLSLSFSKHTQRNPCLYDLLHSVNIETYLFTNHNPPQCFSLIFEDCERLSWTSLSNICFFIYVQFGQVGVGDNVDHCSPMQVQFPHEQACSNNCSSQNCLRCPFIIFSSVEIIVFWLLMLLFIFSP